jgi:uncharacterized membrane protein
MSDGLEASLNAVRNSMDALNERMDEQNKRALSLEETTVTREELRARRFQTAVVSFLVTIMVVIPLLLWAFKTYERSYNATLTKCFITQSQTEADKNRCARKFPQYREAKAQGDERLREFQILVSEIPANTTAREDFRKRIEDLERQVADLEGVHP